jgi:hypothetical protein
MNIDNKPAAPTPPKGMKIEEKSDAPAPSLTEAASEKPSVAKEAAPVVKNSITGGDECVTKEDLEFRAANERLPCLWNVTREDGVTVAENSKTRRVYRGSMKGFRELLRG